LPISIAAIDIFAIEIATFVLDRQSEFGILMPLGGRSMAVTVCGIMLMAMLMRGASPRTCDPMLPAA
jgi:hypothetical protein